MTDKSILTVEGGPKRLLAPGEALDSLSAQRFIRPNLIDYGKRVVKDAEEYPPEEATYQTRAKRGKSYGRGGQLGSLLRNVTARGSETKQAKSAYQRTYNLRNQWHRSIHGVAGATDLKQQIENKADYAGYVMGRKQPYTWRYGWRRLRKIMLDQMDLWILEMESKAFRLWNRKMS